MVTNIWTRGFVTTALIVLLALSWSNDLDRAAQDVTNDKFQSALAVAAIARALNGVISVAQGTEVAIQPIGIGVTLSVGEILDPLNDLVERFSLLALFASVALGIQLTLGNILSSVWLSAILSIAILTYVTLIWRSASTNQSGMLRMTKRWLATIIFARFILAVVLLSTHWIDTVFLADQQQQAMTTLASTSTAIEQLQPQQPDIAITAPEDAGFLDRTSAQLSAFLTTSAQTLDLQKQFKSLQQQVSASVEEMINLIVIFLLQTLLLPLMGLWLSAWCLRAFWRWSQTDTATST
ncbi:MAG: hypothetical protein GXP16_14190 [Gammaproteobacteria bacterium]|nr:hypothetical protein [Gammaproteobacteria bacterium]